MLGHGVRPIERLRASVRLVAFSHREPHLAARTACFLFSPIVCLTRTARFSLRPRAAPSSRSARCQSGRAKGDAGCGCARAPQLVLVLVVLAHHRIPPRRLVD
jgi:hypothetical protein